MNQAEVHIRVWFIFQGVSHKFVIAVLMEYIRSLNQFQITVQVKSRRVTAHLCVLMHQSMMMMVGCFLSTTCTSW